MNLLCLALHGKYKSFPFFTYLCAVHEYSKSRLIRTRMVNSNITWDRFVELPDLLTITDTVEVLLLLPNAVNMLHKVILNLPWMVDQGSFHILAY